jgi:SAM-dependent methyltransferase
VPTSSLAGAPKSVHLVWQTKPQRILDVGCGAGTYGVLLRGFLDGPPIVDGCEAWPDYVVRYRLRGIYDHLHLCYAHELGDDVLATYDTVFMGDVIEHMPKDEALALLERIPGWVVIATPEHHFHNGDGLPPTEAHVSHWTRDDFDGTGRLDHYEVWMAGQYVRLRPR